MYISFGVLIGSFSFIHAFYLRAFNKTIKYLCNAFFGGFCLGFVLSLNCYDVYDYLFPDKIIGYNLNMRLSSQGHPGVSMGIVKQVSG